MANPYAPRKRRVYINTAPAEAAPVAAPAASDVPEGTISEVKSWVGTDDERAQLALDAENAKDEPRVTLVAYLEGLLEDESE